MGKFNFRLLLLTSAILLSDCIKLKLLEKSYKKGLKAYTEERWSECISQFEESLHLYKLYKSLITNCRFKCNNHPYSTDVKESIEDLQFIETYFKRTDCLYQCQNQAFEDLKINGDIDDSLLRNMQNRRPYEYLHMCYYEMNALPKAASAAYTFLIGNPNDKAMQGNLQYYAQQPEVDMNELVDFEGDDYVQLYRLGIKAYNQKNWADTVANLEEVLTDYFSAENICRMECERLQDLYSSTEYVISISNNMASLLHCRQQCQNKLKPLNYNSGVEFVADVLNYLQISYYYLERYNDAAKLVTTYLVLIPKDEDMLENKHIYSSLVDDKAFIERTDVVHYYKRDNYEKKLLNIFYQGQNDNSIDSNSI
ncbi:cartilage-associated protein [Manduca sexta]|uniref:cartilage-associated protein n=1 Tax=Manduca sexta TaxID=7130 RepID=UPI00188EC90B|nr:cartilage-associated protein [Manduca sexta]